MCNEIMSRPYNQKRRAEQKGETRQRIVDAAVELHGVFGPARTSLSMIAERAGVQRHTLYAHFPDERSVLLACSGHEFERDPPPDAAIWRAIPDAGERLRTGIEAIYGWYARNAAMTAHVLRDAEHHEGVREIAALRMGPAVGAWHEVLGAGLSPNGQAMLHLMLGFHSWRALAQESGLPNHDAAALAAAAIAAA
jgi:AcrR family transcriptional regulator